MRLLSYMVPGFPESLFERIADVIGTDLMCDSERSGPAPGDDPFADGRADFGWICSTSFVELSLRQSDPSVRLAGVGWVPDEAAVDGQPVYFGDLVVPAGSTVRSIDDLAGRNVGCNDEVSLSGHYALRFALEAAGYDPAHFANLVFTGGHHASLDRVLAGTLDAAVVDSVVRLQRSRSTDHRDRTRDLAVVQRLGPWPVQPLVVGTHVPAEVAAAAVTALLDSNADPAMQRELAGASLSQFVRVDPDHYASVHAAMAG